MINKTSTFLAERYLVRCLFDYVVCPRFIQFTFWQYEQIYFRFKTRQWVLHLAIFIISLVKGLFQWTIYMAQD